jgi:iron complex outermembrane recepter protein
LFKPDTDTNYEIGLKGKVSNRFSYVADLFFINWQNFQATLYTPFGVNYVANVAPARSQGIELALNGNLSKQLSAGVNYTHIDAYVRQPFEYQAGLPSTTVPEGSPLPGTSKNVFSEYVEYQQPMPGSELLFRVDASYRGPSQSNFANLLNYYNSNFAYFSSISVWNSSITWKKDQYAIAIYGENLSNNRGTSIASTAELYGTRDKGYGVIRPRTFGLRFKWSYK